MDNNSELELREASSSSSRVSYIHLRTITIEKGGDLPLLPQIMD